MSHDETLNRLHELANRLRARLLDAVTVRARLTKARQQARWPDVRRASRRFDHISNPTYVDPPDNETPKH